MEKTVIELFAGVGGFRVGLNEIKEINSNGKALENNNFHFVWANQWEPSTKIQYAYNCYKQRFEDKSNSITNIDISLVNKAEIPNHTLLCGGFPCQDYSVARSLSNEKGIEGKKGVLWWQIYDILKEKRTPFVLLENVDRLLISPSTQRGRDFAIMLKCFDELGYGVEWRVINASHYGHPQRRRRIFIFAFEKSTKLYKLYSKRKKENIINKNGLFSTTFPINEITSFTQTNIRNIPLIDISNNFSNHFENTGLLLNGTIITGKSSPILVNPVTLKEIIETNKVEEHFYLDNKKIEKFNYLRGSKKIPRISKKGIKYTYAEGAMSPTDSLDLPGRTMLTSEGTVNRSTHLIEDPINHRKRVLTPIECERLNQFPDNWTDTMPTSKRYFMMGNALVCGIIEKIGKQLSKIIENE